MRAGPDEESSGASDVVAVLLIVAVTIVLSAMVTTVVLDMGGGFQRDDVASASATFDADADRVRVVFTATQRPGARLDVRLTNLSDDSTVGSASLDRVGDAHTFDAGVADGHRYEVVVVAEWRGERSVVRVEARRV